MCSTYTTPVLMNTCKNELGKEPLVLSWQGCKPLPTIPDENFAVFMLEAMAKVVEGDDGAIAVVDAETGKKRTFSELCELVPRMSAGLAAAGVGLGDRVMYYSLNHTDYPLVYLSVLHRGATIVHISPIYEALHEDMMHALRLSGASWAIVHAELLDQAEAVFSLLPPNTLKKVWVIGGAVDRPAIEDLVAHGPIPPVTQLDGLNPASAVAQMPFSSGTTGPRKGVMISHSNEVSRMIMIKYLADVQEWLGTSESTDSTCLLVTSLSHIYSHIILFASLMFGGKVVLLPHVSSSAMLRAIQEHQVTMAIFTPHHLKMIVESPVGQEHDLSSLKLVTSAGASLSEYVVKAFKNKVGALVYNLYGMTELASFATGCIVTQDWKSLCIGKVMPFFEVKVVDLSSGQLLGAGEIGEICVRSPTTMIGYANNSAATSSMIDAEGWVHTGDYGYYDSQGLIYMTDRIKDLIKSKSSLQVQPSELEDLLLQHPHVAEAVVIGVCQDDFEEMPRAFVVLEPEAPVQPEVLKRFVNDRVPDFKQLTGGVWVVEEIPKNSTGKPMKRQLKAGQVTQLASCC
ncbi:luciferin 4-monooxygenase-like isoform X1 [Scylla paramamosain]|uniref:luciferin 4-monooxygenase-like isoform X1 n=2 Tax=Scylla paramamosain TaxID=85552 RepID=UPI003082C82B